MQRLNSAQLLFATVFLGIACWSLSCGSSEPQFRHDGYVDFLRYENGAFSTISTIDVEMADENRERMQGLKYRSKMAEGQGMFFLFPGEGPLSFWMQDTKIPLDIIYVNDRLQIVDIYAMTEPFSEAQLPSSAPASSVVEVNGGYCARKGIAEGVYIQTRPIESK